MQESTFLIIYVQLFQAKALEFTIMHLGNAL
jgi:hypothetical protein